MVTASEAMAAAMENHPIRRWTVVEEPGAACDSVIAMSSRTSG
jgi:hypothetical protein